MKFCYTFTAFAVVFLLALSTLPHDVYSAAFVPFHLPAASLPSIVSHLSQQLSSNSRRAVDSTTKTTSLLMAARKIEDITYTAKVKKPLGVVFGENPYPYKGLVIDRVEPDQNGDKVGLKVGDNLIEVNGNRVLGENFEIAMDYLRDDDEANDDDASLEIRLFRGPIDILYTLLDPNVGNEREDDQGEEEEEETEEPVIMDENYESPVKVPIDMKDEPLKNVFEALGKLGDLDTENVDSKQKKKGLLAGMFSKETIQLEGDEATGLQGTGPVKREDDSKDSN